MTIYSTVDENGFWCSNVMELALEHMPEHVKAKLIPSSPEGEAGYMKAWKWDGEKWVKAKSYRSLCWYNPERTMERHIGKTHTDAPPAGWLHLPAGTQVDLTAIELWEEIKRERNRRLKETDWTQLPDVPEETRQRYVAYRQALRDITEQPDPAAIVWPEKP